VSVICGSYPKAARGAVLAVTAADYKATIQVSPGKADLLGTLGAVSSRGLRTCAPRGQAGIQMR